MKTRILLDEGLLEFDRHLVGILLPWYLERFTEVCSFDELEKYPYNSIYNRWITEAPENFCVTHDITQADIAIVPFSLNRKFSKSEKVYFENSVQQAKERGIRILGFWTGDEDLNSGFEDIDVYAFSTIESRRSSNIQIIPAWGADLLQDFRDGILPEVNAADRPRLSFCGNGLGAALGVEQKLKRNLRWFLKRDKRKEVHPRARALERCIQARNIEPCFDIKKHEWRGFSFSGEPSESDLAEDQSRFVENLFSSPYALCVRGAGNFSFRFYEVISAGRIPVFIDTDSLLPLNDDIRWRDLIIWVELGEDPVDRLCDFHRTHSAVEIRAQQQRILEMWRNQLRPERFFPRILDSKLARD